MHFLKKNLKIYICFLIPFIIVAYTISLFFNRKETPILQVPIMSDVHINTKVQEERFDRALKDYKTIAPNFKAIVIIGDFTNDGTSEEYDKFLQILNNNIINSCKKIIAIGNHEFYEGLKDSAESKLDEFYIKRFENKIGKDKVYYDKWIKGYHFIVLGSEQSQLSNSKNKDNAIISNEQYNWLEKTLSIKANKSKPIFVFLHQPLSNTVYGSESTIETTADKKLKEILGKYPQVVFFSGHSHNILDNPKTVYQDKFTMVNTGAVAYTCTNGKNGYEYAPSEYSQGLLLSIYKDRIEIKAREFSNHTFINIYTIKFPYKKDNPI